jgi:2-keto-4-pentenoate hydratase/2-oxohepta-3-ene-1,7-dioic acid hydratase in catechol pathway
VIRVKVRRVRATGESGIGWQVLGAGGWEPAACPPLGFETPFRPEWELAGTTGEAGELLPFQPLSFRDFLLFERHYIDASRGWLRRFAPGGLLLCTAYETLTRRPFPPLRPARLWYRQPVYYMSNALTFQPSNTAVRVPPYSQALDYELELGFVLAEPLLDASPAQAEQAIGGFVVLNDLTARDVQNPEMRSGFGPQKAKHFASSMSAVAVTADEVLPRLPRLRGSVVINGEQVASPGTAGMRYSLGEVLAHASRGEQLWPGELFGTGTLPGGSGMETGHWLQPGDRLELAIEGIGEIHHQIT